MSKEFNPSRLKAARIASGLKQTDIAARLDISRQYMNQVESGARVPNEDSIAAFAEITGVLPNYFFRQSLPLASNEDCNFRKQRTTTKLLSEQLVSQAAMISEICEWLSDYVDFPEPNFPDKNITCFSDIEAAAEESRQKWGLGIDSPISNVTRVAERAGVIVINVTGISEKISALSVSGKRPIILHNSLMNQPTRLRFDIAHELGHFVMHAGIHTGDKQTEEEANYYAGAFLLPKAAFIKEFPDCSTRINWRGIFDLKQRWNVSVQAIIRRAYNLSLLSATEYKRAMIYISKSGYRKQEPFEPKTTESPELISQSINLIQSSFNLDAKDISVELGLSPTTLTTLIDAQLKTRPPSGENVINFMERKA